MNIKCILDILRNEQDFTSLIIFYLGWLSIFKMYVTSHVGTLFACHKYKSIIGINVLTMRTPSDMFKISYIFLL